MEIIADIVICRYLVDIKVKFFIYNLFISNIQLYIALELMFESIFKYEYNKFSLKYFTITE